MPDLQPYLGPMIVALIALIALVIVIIIYKLFNQRTRGRKGQRLGITEFHEIDKTRRIVLVRRDDVEHLIMIGGNQDMVIESCIESGLMSDTSPGARTQNEDIVPMRSPKPAVFGSRRPVLRSIEPTIHGDNGEDDGA